MEIVLTEGPMPIAFIQGQEWLIILIAILVLFGGSKIPQLMRGIGRGVSEFQDGIREGKNKLQEGMREAEAEKKQA
jgi:sec-independent protein translocase protein TatA